MIMSRLPNVAIAVAVLAISSASACEHHTTSATIKRAAAARACPALRSYITASGNRLHTPGEARSVVARQFVGSQITGTYAVALDDPVWTKIKPGNTAGVRPMWMVVRRDVVGPLPTGFRGPSQPPEGTVSQTATLVDDQTLSLAGNFPCGSK
jgi:hypothetical protein